MNNIEYKIETTGNVFSGKYQYKLEIKAIRDEFIKFLTEGFIIYNDFFHLQTINSYNEFTGKNKTACESKVNLILEPNKDDYILSCNFIDEIEHISKNSLTNFLMIINEIDFKLPFDLFELHCTGINYFDVHELKNVNLINDSTKESPEKLLKQKTSELINCQIELSQKQKTIEKLENDIKQQTEKFNKECSEIEAKIKNLQNINLDLKHKQTANETIIKSLDSELNKYISQVELLKNIILEIKK